MLKYEPIIVGRAGAGVIFESLYAKKPLLLIPLENASSRGDQVQNATYFSKKGVADVIRQNTLSKQILIEKIDKIFAGYNSYTENIRKLNLPNGKQKAIKIILENKK